MSEQHPTRFPEALREQEEQLIRARREAAKLSGPAKTAPHAALALSGGGIRSATFNLGVLQALARRGLLRRFDYLSTVSGGGYIGSFFGAWVHRRGIDDAEKGLAGMDGQDDRSLPVRYLRENGRYLTPNGSTDAWLSACMQVRSQFTILFLLLLPLLGTILAAEGVKAWLHVLPASLEATTPVASIFWPAAAAFALVTLLPLGTGYWFIGAARDSRDRAAAFTTCVLWAGLLGWMAMRIGGFVGTWEHLLPSGFGFAELRAWGRELVNRDWRPVALSGVGLLLAAAMIAAVAKAAFTKEAQIKRVRRQYTDWLATWAALVALAVLFTAIDTVSQWFAREVQTLTRAAAGPLTLAAVVAVAQRLGPWLAGLGEGSRLKLPAQALAWIAATVVALGIVVGFGATVHLLAINRIAPLVGGGRLWPAVTLVGLGAFAWAIAWLCGRDFRFVNLSSMHRLYSSRLTRAYVGASNPARTGDGARNFDATAVVPGDDLEWEGYRPDLQGGPLHVVNVTINETSSGQSNVDKEDRRGLGMAIGPSALSAGPRANLPADKKTNAAVGALSLGEWVGVSGAAFTTGMGANTSLPLSFLLSLFNVRLGYWWDSREVFTDPDGPRVYPGDPRKRRTIADYSRSVFPAQNALVDEMTAQFSGPSRLHWYLSDGGHFENTACYELIRRQVPLIVCCDCGADPDYNFEDVANLVRKARIDYGSEITFLESEQAEVFSKHLGSLDDLKPTVRADGTSISGKHGAIARVKHQGGAYSVLLLIKPTLSADLPIDLLQYDAKDRSFPQQTTLDQFFDEAQWESHRKLGFFIGEKLFAPAATPAGSPLWDQLIEYARTGQLPRATTGAPAAAGKLPAGPVATD